MVGEVDKAMEYLENAVDIGFINYPLLNEHDPFLDQLRREQRFRALMESVKVQWEQFSLD